MQVLASTHVPCRPGPVAGSVCGGSGAPVFAIGSSDGSGRVVFLRCGRPAAAGGFDNSGADAAGRVSSGSSGVGSGHDGTPAHHYLFGSYEPTVLALHNNAGNRTLRSSFFFAEDPTAIAGVGFSGSGAFFAIGSRDGRVRLARTDCAPDGVEEGCVTQTAALDHEGGFCLDAVDGHGDASGGSVKGGGVTGLCGLGNDGRHFAVGTSDGCVAFGEVGGATASLTTDVVPVRHAAGLRIASLCGVTPNDPFAFVARCHHAALRFDARCPLHTPVAAWKWHPQRQPGTAAVRSGLDRLTSLDVSAAAVATGTERGSVVIFDVRAGTSSAAGVVAPPPLDHADLRSGGVSGIQFIGPSPTLLAVSTRDGSLIGWHADGGVTLGGVAALKATQLFPHPGRPLGEVPLMYSPFLGLSVVRAKGVGVAVDGLGCVRGFAASGAGAGF